MRVFRLGLFFFLFGGVLVSAFSFCEKNTAHKRLRAGSDVLHVEVVATEEARRRGLSGRETIGSDGMLFVFPDAKQRSFWMKEMRFPIDILFIRDGILQEIAENLPPPLLGRDIVTHRSAAPADTVLEVPAGTASDRGWKPGTSIFLE